MRFNRDVDALLDEDDTHFKMDINESENCSADRPSRSSKLPHFPSWTSSPLWFICSVTLMVISLLPLLNFFPNATEFFDYHDSTVIGHPTEFGAL